MSMPLVYGLARVSPHVSPILRVDPRESEGPEWKDWIQRVRIEINRILPEIGTNMGVNEKTKISMAARLMEASNYSAFLFKDDDAWVYFVIADECMRDGPVFEFLIELRRKCRIFLRGSAELDSFFHQDAYQASIVSLLPVAKPRGESFIYTASSINQAEENTHASAYSAVSGDSLCSSDGKLWKGLFGECFYRFQAESTLTICFGRHIQLSVFARVLLMIHAFFSLFFLSVAIVLGAERYNADDENFYHVNNFMNSHFYLLSAISGATICSYIYLLRWMLVNGGILNDSRAEGTLKSFFSFLERVGHYPIMLVSGLLFSIGMAALGFYLLFITAAIMFLFAACFFFIAFCFHVFSRYFPEIPCGWNACKNYVALFSCCTMCRWIPDSCLGLFLKEHCEICAPEPYEGPDIPCCLLSFPCCRDFPTYICDECCPIDQPLTKILLWSSILGSVLSFVGGLILLYVFGDTNSIYETSEYILKISAIGFCFMLFFEFVLIILSIIVSVYVRAVRDCIADMFEKDDNTKPLLDDDDSSSRR